MLKFIRLIFFISTPRINRNQALEIAQDYFGKEGIEISAPRIVEELRAWLIWANGNIKPSPWVRIDNQEGLILETGKPIR